MGTKPPRANPSETLSMADALFSRTQQKVLALIFGRPDRSFYTNEIIEKSGSGSGAVQRELLRLVRSGLVNTRRIGNQRHYQANPDAPVYSELTGLIHKTVGIVEPLRDALKPFEEMIELAFVYGSVAKRVDTAESDVDVLIVSNELSYTDMMPVLEELADEGGRRIELNIYSRDELNNRIQSGNAFITRILQQPKLWLIGDERDLPTG